MSSINQENENFINKTKKEVFFVIKKPKPIKKEFKLYETTQNSCKSFNDYEFGKFIPINPFKQQELFNIQKFPSHNTKRWSKKENELFFEAILKFNNDEEKIKNHVQTRTKRQIRSHAQKFLNKLKSNKYIIEKGSIINLSWKKSIEYLKKTFSEEQLFFLFNENILNGLRPNKLKNKNKILKVNEEKELKKQLYKKLNIDKD